jgi:hypothetical protein
MKHTVKYIVLLGLIAGAVLHQSCNVDIPAYTSYDPYLYSSMDETGGDWELIYLTGNQFI